MRSSSRAFAAMAAFGMAAAGCSAETSGATTVDGSGARLAVIEVRATSTPSETTASVDAVARFVAMPSPSATAGALALLGLSWDAVRPGECTTVGVADVEVPPTATRIELRDLSPVTFNLRSASGETGTLSLEARAFPDVAGLASGVVFVAPGEPAHSFAPQTANPSAAGFDLGTFALPELPTRLTLDGIALADDGSVAADVGADFDASQVADGDRVIVDVVRAGVTRSRCGLDSRGHVHIAPANLVGEGDADLLVRVQRRQVVEEPAVGSVIGNVDARLERQVTVKLTIR